MSTHPNALLAQVDRLTVVAASVERFTAVASSVQRINALSSAQMVAFSVAAERFNALNLGSTLNHPRLVNAWSGDRLGAPPVNALGLSPTIKSL